MTVKLLSTTAHADANAVALKFEASPLIRVDSAPDTVALPVAEPGFAVTVQVSPL